MPQASLTRTTRASSRSAFFTASMVTFGRSTETTEAPDAGPARASRPSGARPAPHDERQVEGLGLGDHSGLAQIAGVRESAYENRCEP